MAATPKKAFGTLLKREITPASGTYVTVAGLTNINWPALETEMAETTDMEAAGGFRTRIPTLSNLGAVSADANYDSDDATQEQMQADLIAQTVRKYKIVGTDTGAADWAFDAYVTKFEISSERDGVITAAIELTPTGQVTRT